MATLSKASNRSLSTDETQSWRWNSSQMILLLTLPCVSATSWFVNIWDEDCMTLDDLRCIKVCQRKMIACKLVFSCNIPSTDLLLMATSTIFWIYSLQMGFAKSSDKCLVIRKTTCAFVVRLASVLFQQTFVKEYVYIRDQYIQESNNVPWWSFADFLERLHNA